MSKFFITNSHPVLVNDIVYDHLVDIKATLSVKTVGTGISVYDPTNQQCQSLGAFIFKHDNSISRKRINPGVIFNSTGKYHFYDYTIQNMNTGTEFRDIITDNGKKIRHDPKLEKRLMPIEMTDIEKKFQSMGTVEQSFVEEICEDVFGVAKRLEINSSTIADMVIFLMEQKRAKYANKTKIMKLKSDIIDKEKEIEIIKSGYYK